MKSYFAVAGACAVLLSAGAAAAADITYTASRDVGAGHVDLSVTTDGTLGALGSADIVDWDITVSDSANSFTLEGPGGSDNSGMIVAGGLSATAMNLIFDFSSGGAFAVQTPGLGSALQAWCVSSGGCTGSGPEEVIITDTHFTEYAQSYSGSQIIASAGGVPEPASWALMIAGFGLAGAALRRRSAGAVAA